MLRRNQRRRERRHPDRDDQAPHPNPILGGVAAFSLYDQASGGYRLAISRSGGAPETLAVAAQPAAFDLDVGPDKAGRARDRLLTLPRSNRIARPGCDLYRYSVATGQEVKLAGASAPNGVRRLHRPSNGACALAWAQSFRCRRNPQAAHLHTHR